MNPFRDGEGLIQLLILLLVVGGSIFRFLYNTFAKPRPRPGPPGEQNKPGLDLRDFLEEIRRQSGGEGAGKARGGDAPQAAPQEKPEREGFAPQPKPERPAEPIGPPARNRDIQQRRQVAQAEGGKRQVGERKRVRKKAPQEPPRAADRASSEPAPVGGESADRDIHEYLEKLSATSTPVPQGKAWAGREGSRAVASSRGIADHDARTFPPLPVLGCTLREAIIAQVILSPPRCRQRSYRRQ